MRVTLVITNAINEELARIVFPTKEAFYAATWHVILPTNYRIEWEEE